MKLGLFSLPGFIIASFAFLSAAILFFSTFQPIASAQTVAPGTGAIGQQCSGDGQGTCPNGYLCNNSKCVMKCSITNGTEQGSCPNEYLCQGGTCFKPQSNMGDLRRAEASQQEAEDWRNLNLEPWQERYYNPTAQPDQVTWGGAVGHNLLPLAFTEMYGPTAKVAQKVGIAMDGGAVGSLGKTIAFMSTTPPAKTAEYIADISRQAGFTQTAYAQGTGWTALTPVLPVWKIFRNVAYMGFVLIFVVIGFMIMFRAKIGQQAVMTIQAAIPQIVVTLLLITFSYAIASLVIDLIYFLIYFVIGIFSSFGILGGNGAEAKEVLFGKNIFMIALQNLLGFGGDGSGGETAGMAANAIGDLVGQVFEGLGGQIVGFLSKPLAYVIIGVAILISVFKLFFKLLMAYIAIIFNVIFAPILLLFNALPGSNSFMNWLKTLLANALLFPATAVMLLIVAMLNNNPGFGVVADVGYKGYATTNTMNKIALPFIGGGIDSSAFMPLIAVGFILFLPSVLDALQKAMGVEGGVAGMMGSAMQPLSDAWKYTGGRYMDKYRKRASEYQGYQRDARVHGTPMPKGTKSRGWWTATRGAVDTILPWR